jgi:xylan 1,4-beta-xylosidase
LTLIGKDEMQQVQFCIGREIGTAGHWSGTPEQFYEFYRISINAVREVLPVAKVGSHFLWATSRHSWGPDFVRWCKANNVHYDFIGVSFYPFYHQIGRVDLDSVYIKDFAPIKDIPEWNKNAKLEMHEFALIKSMGEAGNTFESAPNEHQNAFTVMLMKMFYENDMHNLFQWGNGANIAPATKEFLSMKGNTYYTSTKSGTPKDTGNMVDALFSRDLPHNQYNIIAYNYNANPTSATSEQVVINATIGTPPGTRLKYRLAIYQKPDNTLPWSDWQNGTTKGNLYDKSTISFYVTIPAFSFLKYEIMILL